MDIATISAGLAAARSGFDVLRGAIGLAKDAKSLLPDGAKKDAVDRALQEADTQIRLGEAQIAQALGYPLCKCSFPPKPMLLVGYWKPARFEHTEIAIAAQIRKAQGGGAITMDVHECPLCKRNDAADHHVIRYDCANSRGTAAAS